MKQYIQNFQTPKEDLGVADKDTLIMDEIGIWIGCRKPYWIISIHREKHFLLINLDNQDSITSMKIIGDGERDILPIVILTDINILEK